MKMTTLPRQVAWFSRNNYWCAGTALVSHARVTRFVSGRDTHQKSGPACPNDNGCELLLLCHPQKNSVKRKKFLTTTMARRFGATVWSVFAWRNETDFQTYLFLSGLFFLMNLCVRRRQCQQRIIYVNHIENREQWLLSKMFKIHQSSKSSI